MIRPHLTAMLLFLLLMTLPLPFLPEFGGANSATRLMLTGALVEEGSTEIDRHATLTVDKALVGDHYYSDKARGWHCSRCRPMRLAVRLPRTQRRNSSVLTNRSMNCHAPR